MGLFAIGDLHLHFQSELKAVNQRRDPACKDHEAKLRQNCLNAVRESDTLVLAGDHSWGKNLSECERDLQYIMDLPGKKVLLRGNHDMFWDAKKTEALNRQFAGKLFFLQDNYYPYGDCALVGTKGYTFEGPFCLNRRGQITGYDQLAAEHAEKLVRRESERLERSFEAARQDGYRRFIMFLHYPPTSILETCSAFTELAERFGAEKVIYAHCHGTNRFHDSLEGYHSGIEYRLVSGDFLGWRPDRILP